MGVEVGSKGMANTDHPPAATPPHTSDLDERIAAALEGVPDDNEDDSGEEEPGAPVDGHQGEEPGEPEGGDAGDDDEEQPKDAEDGAEGEQEPEGDESAQRAINALRTQGVSESVLTKLGPDGALEFWTARKAAETKTQTELQKRNQRIAELEARLTTKPADGGEHSGVPAPKSEPLAVSEEEASAAYAAVEEELGPDARKALEKLLSPLQRQAMMLEQQLRSAQATTVAQRVAETRVALGERFPEANDDARWVAVQDAARSLSERQKYRDIEAEHGERAALTALFQDAARAEGLAESKPQDRARQKKVDAARRSGTPTTVPPRSSRVSLRTPEERLNEAIRLAEKGLTAREIDRMLG